MQYKARKVGNSLGVTIPSFVVKQLNIKDGDNLSLKLKDKEIIIRKEKTNEEN